MLPTRVAWVAYPEVTGDDVAEVEYLIDDRLAWVADDAPYTYGSVGNRLVTTFLRPGVHSFTTRVVTLGGATGEQTVDARVQPAPPVPSDLRGGTWLRQVSGGGVMEGQWTVTPDSSGWFFGDPRGGGVSQDVSYRAVGQVTLHALIEAPPFGSYRYGGAFCEQPDPSATYAYTLSPDGRSLTFAVVGDDPCDSRQSLLEDGTWRQPAHG